MNKVEKKRQKEQYVVEEMIRLYCRKNYSCKRHVVNKRTAGRTMEKRGMHPAGCVRNVRN